jgi:hypothetical protein
MAFKMRLGQQGLRAVVGQLHPALLVEHQNAGAHALQNQSVEGFRLVTSLALFGEIFADFQARIRP